MYLVKENGILKRNVNCLVRFVGKYGDRCLRFGEAVFFGVF